MGRGVTVEGKEVEGKREGVEDGDRRTHGRGLEGVGAKEGGMGEGRGLVYSLQEIFFKRKITVSSGLSERRHDFVFCIRFPNLCSGVRFQFFFMYFCALFCMYLFFLWFSLSCGVFLFFICIIIIALLSLFFISLLFYYCY